MEIRFSPYAIIKTISFNSLMESQGIDGLSGALQRVLDIVQSDPLQALSGNTALFKNIGLAENVSVDEEYRAEPVWGIGEPANPIVVPNNYAATISISRITLDTLSVRDFTTLPDYWYVSGIHERIHNALGPAGLSKFLDYPFYTFLWLHSVEAKPGLVRSNLEWILERPVYLFMPSSYSRRITSGDSIIVTDVRGTGKLFTLNQIIKAISDAVRNA